MRPINKVGKVPVTIKGANAREFSKSLHYKIRINAGGEFEAIQGSGATTEERVEIDHEALDQWMETKWEAVSKEDKLVAQWIDIPLEFTFID